jgi:hypothetical protein
MLTLLERSTASFPFCTKPSATSCRPKLVNVAHGVMRAGASSDARRWDGDDRLRQHIRASVEVQHGAQTALVQVIWQHRSFMVHLPDLLDACRVEDVGEITCRGGLGSAFGEAE